MSKNALSIAMNNKGKVALGVGLAGLGTYSLYKAKQTHDKKENANFTIISITNIDSNIINIKFNNLDNIKINSNDKIILKNTNTIPILNGKYSINNIISNTEIEVIANINITSNGTSGEMLLDTTYSNEFINATEDTTGGIIKGASNLAGNTGNAVGSGLLIFLSKLLGTTPDDLKFYGKITLIVIILIMLLGIGLKFKKILTFIF